MSDLLEDAKKLIRTHSVTAEGNEEIANLLHDRMKETGFKVQLQHVTHSLENVSKRQFNLIGVLGDPLVDKKTKKGLLLATHLDTVGPGLAANWTQTGGDAFNPTLKDGKLYGLGSADTKLDFLCKLKAAEKFREKKLKQPIYLVGTCGEEVGMFGTKYLIQSGILNPRYAVVAEPSELSLIYAHKSLNLFKITIGFQMVAKDARGFNRRIQIHSLGKSAHGAYPQLGQNAIHQLFDLIRDSIDQGYEMKFSQLHAGETMNKVPDQAMVEFFLTSHQFEDYKRFFRDLVQQTEMEKSFRLEAGGHEEVGIRFIPDAAFQLSAEVSDYFRRFAQQFAKVTDSTYNPNCSTVNFGMLKQPPNGLELHFDLRILPDQDADAIHQQIVKDIQALAAKHPHLNVTCARQRTNPGLNMTENHDLVRLCKDSMIAAGLPVKLDKKATSTEAAQFFKAGYESVVFGPGVSHGNSHSPNEYQLVDHLEKATLFYEKLIERVCL